MRQLTRFTQSSALWLAAALVLMLLRYGYEPLTGSNHCYQYIVVHRIAFPHLYPHDAFVEITWRGYASVLWYLIGYTVKWTGIAEAALDISLFIANRLLIILAFAWIAQAIFSNERFASCAAVALLLIGIGSPVGGGQPIRSSMEQTGFAVAFGLMSLYALLQRRPALMSLTLGLCLNFNTMYGIFVSSYLMASIFLSVDYRIDWRRWLLAVLVGIGFGAPGIWLTISAARRSVGEMTAVWQALELAYPYHFYPFALRDAMSLEKHVYFIVLAILALLLLQAHSKSDFTRRHLLLWFGVMAGWYSMSWVAPLTGALMAIRIQPIRGIDYGYIIFSIYVFYTMVAHLARLVVTNRFALPSATILPVILLWGAGLWATGQASIKRLYREGSLIRIASPACSKASEWARRNTSIDAVFLVPIGMDEGWHNFRHLSKRNVFVTWKDGCAWIWASAYAPEWLSRIEALGFFEIAQLNPSRYARGCWVDAYFHNNQVSLRLTESEVILLAKRFKIDYWVAYAHQKTTLPVVYQEANYKIVRLGGNQ